MELNNASRLCLSGHAFVLECFNPLDWILACSSHGHSVVTSRFTRSIWRVTSSILR